MPKDITAEEVKGMMYPEDMDDDAVLIPVDVSGEEEGFPTSCEDLLEKVGASGAAKAIVDAAEFFEKNKVKKFGNDQRPIPMTVGEWMSYMMADEGGAEENGEEEELEDDEEVSGDTETSRANSCRENEGPISKVSLPSSVRARRLQDSKVITNELDYASTSFSFTFKDDIEPPLQCQPNDCQPTATGIYAGVTVSQVELIIDPDTFNAPGAKLRLVRDEVDRAGANTGQCKYGSFQYGAHSSIVNTPWAADGAGTITTDGSMQAKTDPTTFIPLTFKMGGIYHICYSDDGTFDNGHSDIVPQRIEVYGIYDLRTECAEDEACLTKRPYNCFLRRQAYNNMEDTYDGTTSCVVDYSYEGAGYSGLPGRGSWTGAFATSYDTNGMVTSEVARTCGSADLFDFPASFLCNADTSCGAITDPRNPYIAPDATNQYSRMTIPAARPDLVGPEYKAYAVAVCYCPDFQRCDSYSPDYVQQVGLLYFFATKVCPNGFEAEADGCSLDFTGAAPQHRFALRVECPSTACAYAADSRVKVVQQAASNNLPSWDPMSGCGSAVHGINTLGMQVLPADDNPDVATMHGGMRQDYKIWNFKNSSSGLIYDTKTSGFQFRIKKTRLIGLVVAGFGCMCILGLLGVWSQFEIHLERRSLRKELRKEEHHAASKLAQVGMELWSEYRDDIHESHEAQMLMKILNTSYGTFEAKVKSTVDASSKQLGLDKEKAAKLADTLLHLVADQQQQGLKHTKRLVDHLVEVGKRAVPLEKAAEKEARFALRASRAHYAIFWNGTRELVHFLPRSWQKSRLRKSCWKRTPRKKSGGQGRHGTESFGFNSEDRASGDALPQSQGFCMFGTYAAIRSRPLRRITFL
ncbi:unnamed protein product [Effrenium voratum]|nr:unnamed protein product [Effrenium voratum]